MQRRLLPLLALVATCLFLFVSPILAASVGGNKVLVLLDDAKQKSLFTKFFKALEGRGFELDYQTAKSKDVSLIQNEERVYDHVLHFAPKAKTSGKNLGKSSWITFLEKGGNVLLAASSSLSESVRDLAAEFSVDFDDKGTAVIDHFNYDAKLDDGKKHVAVKSNSFSPLSGNVVVPKSVASSSVVFKGVGHKLTGKNQLAFPILQAASTAYSYDLEDASTAAESDDASTAIKPMLVGKKTVLVSALQARNNARVVVSGSLDMFTDAFLAAEGSDNKAFVDELAKWAFHEKGVVKKVATKHHKKGEKDQLETYRIKDEVEFDLELSQWNGKTWVPLELDDIQMEAIMLDPYIRTTFKRLSSTSASTQYRASYKLPDTYGVFTYKIDYRRYGYTYLEHAENVIVRPFHHNEYDRFLSIAWPYYVSSFSMMAGFWVVCWLFLFNREPAGVQASGEKVKSN